MGHARLGRGSAEADRRVVTDFLTQYIEATERHVYALQSVQVELAHRRAALVAMRNDGMTVQEIGRLVHLKAGTITRMLAKVDRELARLDEEIIGEPE